MNWVGGARSRIKLKQEKKQQQEFFEKKRFVKRASSNDLKTSQSTISQDLIFLQTVANCSNSSLTGCNANLVKKINLEGKFNLQHRKKCVDLPISPGTLTSQLQLAGPQDDQLSQKNVIFNNSKGTKGKNVSSQIDTQVTLLEGIQSNTENGKPLSVFPSHLDFLCRPSFSCEDKIYNEKNSVLNSMDICEDFQELAEHNASLNSSFSPSCLEHFKRQRYIPSSSLTYSKPTYKHTTKLASPLNISEWNSSPFQQTGFAFDDLKDVSNWTSSSSSSNKTNRATKHVNKKSCRNQGSRLDFFNPDVILYQTQPFLPPTEISTQSTDAMQHEIKNDIEEDFVTIHSKQMVSTTFSLVNVTDSEERSYFFEHENAATLELPNTQNTRERNKNFKDKKNSSLEMAEFSNLKTRLERSRKSDMLDELEESFGNNLAAGNTVEAKNQKEFQGVENDAIYATSNVECQDQTKCKLNPYEAQITYKKPKNYPDATRAYSIAEHQSTLREQCKADGQLTDDPKIIDSETVPIIQKRTASIAAQCSLQVIDAYTQTSPLQVCNDCAVAEVVNHLAHTVSTSNCGK